MTEYAGSTRPHTPHRALQPPTQPDVVDIEYLSSKGDVRERLQMMRPVMMHCAFH